MQVPIQQMWSRDRSRTLREKRDATWNERAYLIILKYVALVSALSSGGILHYKQSKSDQLNWKTLCEIRYIGKYIVVLYIPERILQSQKVSI